ncbi:hypothetical protein [Aquabacterium sp.]|uniref:hypothetical protein n=1 Tax=Aquabacterium sp. TaxID=1872578 RepID=UPI0025C2FCEA|nr:hypothetical protein [Aquabacterium sp.]
MTQEQQKEFWKLAQCWAGSTMDTPKRATMLLEFVEGLMSPPEMKPPPEGILHHALRDQMNREAAARDAAEGLRAIEDQLAKRERRLAAEQRREDDRRHIVTAAVDVRADADVITIAVQGEPWFFSPRSGDMVAVFDAKAV